MATRADEANLKRSYNDFEPFCEWTRNEEYEMLEVNLQGTYSSLIIPFFFPYFSTPFFNIVFFFI